MKQNRIHTIINDRTSVLFIILSTFFIGNTLIAEFVGVKIFSLEKTLGFDPMQLEILGIGDLGFNLTAGVLLWPIVFIMTDLINEYFGKKSVRFLSFLAVGIILYAFFMVYGTILLEPNTWWDTQSGLSDDPSRSIPHRDLAYQSIMGQGLWIIVGSMVAFLVGQVVDVTVFQKIKKHSGESKLWLRATGSTLVSQLLDSYVVLMIAFYFGADWPIDRVLAIGTINYIYKFVVALGLTPLLYLLHGAIDSFLGHEVAEDLKKEAALSSD